MKTRNLLLPVGVSNHLINNSELDPNTKKLKSEIDSLLKKLIVELKVKPKEKLSFHFCDRHPKPIMSIYNDMPFSARSPLYCLHVVVYVSEK